MKNDELCDNWKYFIKDNIENNGDKLNPTDITFIDPCLVVDTQLYIPLRFFIKYI